VDVLTNRTIGRYRVIGVLGAGAMGEVLRARDERLGREVAIKRVKNVFGAMTTEFHARFEAEARALAALAHPGVVQVFDLGFEGEEPYLVMEMIDGPSLRAMLQEHGPLSPQAGRALGIQLARALEAAHGRGILHRDIKPANVLHAPGGLWKLADFGVARMPDSEMTITGQFIGTPAYAAPEALALGQFSPASDVFGLAATLFEAVTGAKPRRGAGIAELVASTRESVSLVGVPSELLPALTLAFALDPRMRPTAATFAEMLAGSAGHVVHPVPAPTSTVAVPDEVSAQSARAPISRTTPVPDGSSFEAAGAPLMTRPLQGVIASPKDRRPPWGSRRRLAAMLAAGAGIVATAVLVLIGRSCAKSDGHKPAAIQRANPQGEEAADVDREPSDSYAQPAAAGAGEPIRFEMPPRLDRWGEQEWAQVAADANEGRYRDALQKLWAFEQRFGETQESARLRTWLEQAATANGDRFR
jgi:hypothetical protein